MPIYAYRCTACGHAQDVLQKMSDPLLTVCPACGASAYAKQLTAAGFQLKGSGWYVTDFRGGNTAAPKPADGSETPPPADKAGDKPGEKTGEKTAEKTTEKAPDKGPDKGPDRGPDRGQEKPKDKPASPPAPTSAPSSAPASAPTPAAGKPTPGSGS